VDPERIVDADVDVTALLADDAVADVGVRLALRKRVASRARCFWSRD